MRIKSKTLSILSNMFSCFKGKILFNINFCFLECDRHTKKYLKIQGLYFKSQNLQKKFFFVITVQICSEKNYLILLKMKNDYFFHYLSTFRV